MSKILNEIIDYLNKNQLDKAYELCELINDKKLDHIILNIKGVIFLKNNKINEAKKNFLKSSDIDKEFIDPHKNLFQLYMKTKDLKSAIEKGKKIIDLELNKNPLSYFNLAYAYDLNKDLKKAVKLYKITESLNFKEKKILFNNLAKCYLSLKKINEAKNYYLKALKFDPNDKVILNNLLILFLRIGDEYNSEYFFKKAKKIDENYIEFQLNRSEYFLSKNKIDEAIKNLEIIIKNKKNYIAYTKLAKIYSMLNNNKKAIEIIDEALTFFPNDKNLKFTRGMHYLIQGEFKKGWEFYELRDSTIKYDLFKNIKKWDGEDLKDSKILVTCEQGMGDVLQFSKFLINLSSLAKKIDFLLYDKLIPIFKKEFNNIKICNMDDITESHYNYQISIGSLNKFFYKKNTCNSSDLINFDENEKKKWNSFFKLKKNNIGIIWSGNFFGPKEPLRSIELKNFENILKLNANFYSFQNEIWDRDKEFFKKTNIIDYSNKSFFEIIAIIQNLDLVISTDTFFLHLACICNKETWGLISLNPDWRWYDYYKLNPYKTLKIYKQTQYKNWKNIMKLIHDDLKNKFSI